MIRYSLSEAAQAMPDSRRITARDALDIARFTLGLMIVPVLMTGLYLRTACL